MKVSRRQLALLLPAAAAAQQTPLPSHVWRYQDLPVKTNGDNRSRDVFKGTTHAGFGIDMHETELAPGRMPHPAHHHEHEEMLMMRDGTIEMTIAGVTQTAGPGDVVFVASNQEHGLRNPGPARAKYLVLALGR